MPRQHFLFLQGLPGPSFRMLACELRQLGSDVSRINFNGGDVFDWRGGGATSFRGSLEEWRNWLDQQLAAQSTTDIVLFGEFRPYHQVAIELATKHDLPVHVLEEGYLRPNYVTYEAIRVGKKQNLPKSYDECERLAQDGDAVVSEASIPSSFGARARESSLYWVFVVLLYPVFHRYRSHRQASALREAHAWCRRWVFRRRENADSASALQAIKGKPFFLFPLQIDGDAQLVARSKFSSMREVLLMVLASFEQHAPQDAFLLVKRHPFDPDFDGWRREIGRIASRAGASERILFVERADLDPLLEACRGVITVNSTVGPLALAKGKPVHIMGESVYGFPELVHSGTLEEFWKYPTAPARSRYEVFANALRISCQINAGFHSRDGLQRLVEDIAARLMRRH